MRGARAIVGSLVVVLLGVFIADAIRKNWCDNPISSGEEALAFGRKEAIRRDLFSFPEFGGTRGFIAKLTDTDCCEASKHWDWSRMTFVWGVSFSDEQKGVIYVRGIPRYYGWIGFTQCRFVLHGRKMKWD
jgi:hypothetical protein